MEKKLQDLTDTELKAMAYDLLALLQRAQQDLNVINSELTRRVAPAQQPQAGQVIPRFGGSPVVQ